jgi:uncharacterized membrane protein YoaK (UPF0700 family)
MMAGIAVMIAVSAMACQYALLRPSLPGAISTAVMTEFCQHDFVLMDLLSKAILDDADRDRLRRSVQLSGFLFGCVVAAVAVSLFADWAWSFPVALAA